MKVAVVGANGFIGQRLCAALQQAPLEVLPVSSRSGTSFDVDNGLLRALPVDPAVTAVVYLSQWPHYRDVPNSATHLWGVNVVSAIKAAEWARRSGAARFIYASSGNVYQPAFHPLREDDPLQRDNWYALSKVQAEEALRLYQPHLKVTCLRLFAVYGPGQRGRLIPNLVEAVRTDQPISLASHPADPADTGGLKLSLTHVDDVVAVLQYLIDHDGPETANVAGSEVRSIRQIATTIGESLGCAPQFRQESARQGDFVGDNRRVLAVWPGTFRDFATGIRDTLNETLTA